MLLRFFVDSGDRQSEFMKGSLRLFHVQLGAPTGSLNGRRDRVEIASIMRR